MTIHRNELVQILPISLKDTWNFFSNPQNLARLTPEEMNFKHVYEPDQPTVYPGMMLVHTVSPVAGIPLTWVTEITQVEPMLRFVDEQRKGPFGMWHHIHMFREVPEGSEVRDLLYYEMPFGFLGNIVHSLFVKKQIEEIFEYRKKRLTALFSK